MLMFADALTQPKPFLLTWLHVRMMLVIFVVISPMQTVVFRFSQHSIVHCWSLVVVMILNWFSSDGGEDRLWYLWL